LTSSVSAQAADVLSLPPQYQSYLDILSAGPSAVKVNIVNTASNFIVTALLGAIVFGEKLPLLWWVGAGFLVAGSVVIGRRDEHDGKPKEE
jgi:uncharacterized membrane protein